MSVLTKKLHVMKTAGADEAISLYTTTSECAEPNLKLQVDGTTAYAKLGSVSDSNATSLRVLRNSDNTTYAVLKAAMVKVTITQSANQTIKVWVPKKSGGTAYTASFTVAVGTTYEAEVVAADGYTAGTLKATVGGTTGTLTQDVTFSAGAATQDWDGTVTAYFGYDSKSGNETSSYYFGYMDDFGSSIREELGSLSSTTWKNSKGSITINSIYGYESDGEYGFNFEASSNKTGCTSVKLLINGYTQTVAINKWISRRRLNTGDMIDWFAKNADNQSGAGKYTIKYKFV